MDDKQFAKAMGIRLDEALPEPAVRLEEQPLHIRPLRSEEPEYFLISEGDFWTLDHRLRSLQRRNADLDVTVQNWIERARENGQATRVWRNVCLILGCSMAAIEGVRLWGWLR